MTRNLLLSMVVATTALCQSTPSADEQSRGILDKALKESNPDTRKQAVIALSLAGSGEPFLSQVAAMLDDKDVEVRLAAVASLVDLPTERTTVLLRKALNDDVPEVSFAAARALWSLNDPEGKAALFSILSGETKATTGFFPETEAGRDATDAHAAHDVHVRIGAWRGFRACAWLGSRRGFHAGPSLRCGRFRARNGGATFCRGKKPGHFAGSSRRFVG